MSSFLCQMSELITDKNKYVRGPNGLIDVDVHGRSP